MDRNLILNKSWIFILWVLKNVAKSNLRKLISILTNYQWIKAIYSENFTQKMDLKLIEDLINSIFQLISTSSKMRFVEK